jgi:cytoskeletal protein RodZ
MNRLYRLPLRTRAKNLSSGVRRRQNSSKVLATVILAACALAAMVAIGFAAFLTYKHLKGKPKPVATAAASPAVSPSPAASGLKPKEILLPLADPNQTSSSGTASSHPSDAPQSSPPVLTSLATPMPSASVAPTEQKADSQPKNPDKPATKAARRILEKKRLDAEHKRARLEKMFQNHEISADAYNKGKEEYKVEIQKYRNAIKTGD